MEIKANSIIELTVQNHPGVMSHITGLFARRAFNLEGILCAPVGDGTKSRMYLLVEKNSRLEQILKQLQKLYDVLEIKLLPDTRHRFFNSIEEYINGLMN